MKGRTPWGLSVRVKNKVAPAVTRRKAFVNALEPRPQESMPRRVAERIILSTRTLFQILYCKVLIMDSNFNFTRWIVAI